MTERPGIISAAEAKYLAFCATHAALFLAGVILLFRFRLFEIFAVWMVLGLLSFASGPHWAAQRWLRKAPPPPCDEVNAGTRAVCHLRRGHKGPHAAWLSTGALRFWDGKPAPRWSPDAESSLR